MSLMTGCSIYFMFSTIKGYIDSPTITKIQSVSESKLDMPEVVICNSGGMNISAMLEANFSKELIAALMSQRPSERALTTKDELTRFRHSRNMNVRDVYEHFSFSCERMVTVFAAPNINQIDSTQFRCNKALRMFSPNGICYHFKKNGQQVYPGGGIEITLKGISNSRQQLFSKEELLHLRITNDYLLTIEKEFGRHLTGRYVNIPLDSLVTVTLNTKRYVRLVKANPCDNNPEQFTSNTCYINCYMEQFVEDCNCLPKIDGKNFKHVDVCDPLAMFHCNLSYSKLRRCEKLCLPKCEEWIFENTISVSTLLNGEGATENSTSLVSINYNTMQYTLIEEVEAFTMDMAIANVGGQAGLWLGASFVTIIQAVYYLVLGVREKWMQRRILPCEMA